VARLLLDTHVLLWSLAEPARMRDRARDAIDQLARQNRVFALARDLLPPPLMSGELEP